MKPVKLSPPKHDSNECTVKCDVRRTKCGATKTNKASRLDTAAKSKISEDFRRYCRTKMVQQWSELKRRSLPSDQSASSVIYLGGGKALTPDVNGNEWAESTQSYQEPERIVERSTGLPIDPRLWTSQDILQWLNHMAKLHNMNIDTSFFQMNGHGLCLMSLQGFLFRVPEQGRLLHTDFRERLRSYLLAPGMETKRRAEHESPLTFLSL